VTFTVAGRFTTATARARDPLSALRQLRDATAEEIWFRWDWRLLA
jgi:hypothetical protein